MVPYASEVVLAQAVPYGMTGIMLPAGGFVSGETIMTAAMATGYTVTGSNMLVKVNDSVAGLTGTNMMAGTMGQANYQLVKGTSKGGSDVVIGLGVLNSRLYGTNNNVGNIKENASYKNGKNNFENEIPRSGEEWETFFKEKYGSENVVWESNPVNETIRGIENGSISLTNNIQKGNYGEMKMDVYFENKGYKRISLDKVTDINTPTHHGIDGVYYNPDGHPPYVIGEAKYGSSKLTNTMDGMQMSDTWINGGDRLVNAVGKDVADDILLEGYGKSLVNISSDGTIKITDLN